MQKVVTIHLQSWRTKHLHTEELLADYLAEGWRVISATAGGGGVDACGVCVWAIFVLEK